ncbi:MAG: putative lipoic acid-binding regulatory protein [Chlamydiales bacterium]|jgi:putative lipoic acid-binding regulatory protein
MVIGEEESPLIFPCEYPVTFMGLAESDFEAKALRIIEKHVGVVFEDKISRKISRQGKYVSVTVTVSVEARKVLEAIYRDFSSCDDIVMTL